MELLVNHSFPEQLPSKPQLSTNRGVSDHFHLQTMMWLLDSMWHNSRMGAECPEFWNVVCRRKTWSGATSTRTSSEVGRWVGRVGRATSTEWPFECPTSHFSCANERFYDRCGSKPMFRTEQMDIPTHSGHFRNVYSGMRVLTAIWTIWNLIAWNILLFWKGGHFRQVSSQLCHLSTPFFFERLNLLQNAVNPTNVSVLER